MRSDVAIESVDVYRMIPGLAEFDVNSKSDRRHDDEDDESEAGNEVVSSTGVARSREDRDARQWPNGKASPPCRCLRRRRLSETCADA